MHSVTKRDKRFPEIVGGGTSNAKLACLGLPTWFHRGSSLSDSPAKRSRNRPPGTRRQFLGFASRGRPLFGTPHGSPKDNVSIAWQGFFMNRGQLINVPECRGNTPQKQRHGNPTGSCTVGGCRKRVETRAAGYGVFYSSCSEGRAVCGLRTSQRELSGERCEGDI